MTELRKMLDDLAEEAKTYDVVERAQRRARRRRWTLPAAASAAVLLAAAGTVWAVGSVNRPGHATPLAEESTTPAATTPPPPAPPPPVPTSCVAAQLPVPDGYPAKSIVSGGDPTGRYIIGRAYPSLTNPDAPSYEALLWDNGEVTALEVPGGEVVPEDVNSSGEVAITSYLDAGTAGFYYYEGIATQLAGEYGEVHAINDGGAIVGSVLVPTGQSYGPGQPIYRQRPALWRTPSSEPELLGPADLEGFAVGIDNDGTITVLAGGDRNQRPGTVVRFAPDGAMTEVPFPATPGFSLMQIRGYVNGWATVADNTTGLVFRLWHIGDAESYPLTGSADAVNGHGWVAVNLNPIPRIGEPFSPEGTAYLLTPEGAKVDLPPITGTYASYAILTAFLSDDGRTVAGQLIDPTYESPDADDIAVVWHCN